MKTNPKMPVNLRKFKSGLVFVLLTLVVGCVTVNVNFPEGAVQKASDDYVRDLYRTKEQSKAPTPKASSTPSALFQWIVPNANADDLPLNMSSPKIASIKNVMKALIPDIIEQKKAGVLGETFDGKLTIHGEGNLKPLLKKKVEELVKNDNSARDLLYAEVIRSNGLPPSSLASVKRTFARSFQAESPSGTWVQNMDGSWTQKQ